MMDWQTLLKICRYPEEIRFEPNDFMGIMLREDTRALLHEKLQEYQPKLVLEIGSWIGFSANFITDRVPGATLICCDIWRGSREIYEMNATAPYVDESYDRFIANTWHKKDRIIPFKIDGVNGTVMVWETGKVPDLIFIDGGHQYESVWGDIHANMRCFPGKPIVLDDWDHPGVRDAIPELCDKFKRTYKQHGIAAFIYP